MRPQSARAITVLAITLACSAGIADETETDTGTGTDTGTEAEVEAETDTEAETEAGTEAGTTEPETDEIEKIYLEEDGVVLFEVEDAEVVEDWELKTEIEGFRGDGYFEWVGPQSFSLNTAGTRGAIKYYFRIHTAGNYQMRWRNRIAVGESNTEHNDSWLRLATGTDILEEQPLHSGNLQKDGWIKVYSNNRGSWSWNASTVDHDAMPIRQFFSQGDHTLEISARSLGHAIDQIALYRYPDVNYSPQIANNWELSQFVAFDGTITAPSDPEENPDPPEETPDPPEPVALINLALAPDDWQDLQNNQCVSNTLALPASDAVMFDPSDSNAGFASGIFATVSQGSSALLLKFDTSLVPVASTAVLEYSTGEDVSDGELRYALGSHSDWQSDDGADTLPPDFLLELGRASGGWETTSRYHSSILATALASGNNTLIISSETESEPLSIFAEPGSDLAPRLLLTGGTDFCTNWQANVDASNEPVDPPEEINEQTETEVPEEPEETVEPEVEVEVDTPDSTGTGRSGGSTSLWMLFGLLLPLMSRWGGPQRQHSVFVKRTR